MFVGQETEEKIGAGVQKVAETVAETEPVKSLVLKYEKLKETNPALARDIEAALGIGELITTVAGVGAGGLGTKAASKVIGQATKSVLQKSTEVLGDIVETGASGISKAVSVGLKPEQIMQRVARISKSKQAAFKEAAGVDVGEYLVKKCIFGNIDEISTQLYKNFKQSKDSVDTTLDSLKGTFKTTPVGNALKQLLEREQRVSSPGAISKDLERVRALNKKHDGSGLTMSEINEVKRLYERNVKLDYLKENIPDKVEKANTLDSAIRLWQQNKASELGFKNIRELNRETRLAKQLLDDLGAEYSGALGNNSITLTDWIVLSGGDPSSITGFLAKKTLSSKGIQSKIAKTLSPKPEELLKPEIGEPTIDGYLNFLKKTGGVNENNLGAKVIGTGEFGKIYDGLKGQDAVDFLLKNKSGEVKTAFNHPDIGNIDLVWGKTGENGFGLSHILEQRPELVKKLKELIENGNVEFGANRAFIETPDHKAVIGLNWFGEEKKWVLTSYGKEKK